MVTSDSFAEFLSEQLAPLGRVTLRRMFGKTGVFCDGLMLGMVTDNTLYFRIDDHNREAFKEAESFPPLNYRKRGSTIDLSFWRAPERLFDEPDEFVTWARIALAAARRVAAKRGRTGPRQKSKPQPRKEGRRSMGSAPAGDDMPRSFYDGTTLNIRIYDSIDHSGRPVLRGDIAFYRDLALRAKGEVLEIGVGTGRVAVELANAGIRVTGLDLSAAMLAIAGEKAAASGVADRLRLECGDMRNFDLSPQQYGLIIVPYRAFQVLLTPEDQLSALSAFRRHLRSGGILALHLFDPDLRFLLPGASPPIDTVRGTDCNTGRPVEAVLETDTLDHVNQIRRELWRYRAFAANGAIAEEEMLVLAIRWTFRWEMRHLLRLAGLVVEAEFSDFQGSPPAYGKEQIWIAHKSPGWNTRSGHTAASNAGRLLRHSSGWQ